MLAMDVSISSTSTCLLPATFLCRLSSTLVHDLAASYGHLVFFFGFLFQQSSTALAFLHLQVSVSCTINSSFETMGEVLHIVSELVFSYMQLERTFLVLLKRGPGHFSYWHHSKFESGKDLLLHNVVSVHNSHDISLSTPLSRLWGKPLQPRFLPYAAGMYIFLLLNLGARTFFPSDIIPFRRAGRPHSLLQVTHLLFLAQCSKARDKWSRTLLWVTGPDSFLVAFSFHLYFFFGG